MSLPARNSRVVSSWHVCVHFVHSSGAYIWSATAAARCMWGPHAKQPASSMRSAMHEGGLGVHVHAVVAVSVHGHNPTHTQAEPPILRVLHYICACASLQGRCEGPPPPALQGLPGPEARPLEEGQCIIATSATFAAPSHPLWLDNLYIKATTSSDGEATEAGFAVIAADRTVRSAEVWLTRSVIQGGFGAAVAPPASVAAVSTSSRFFAQGALTTCPGAHGVGSCVLWRHTLADRALARPS